MIIIKQKASWIWTKEKNLEETQLVYFRKDLFLKAIPQKAVVKISADSRYKCYVNQQLVEVGPSKGDKQIWYADRLDLSPYLIVGHNVIGVEVLHYNVQHNAGNFGTYRTNTPGLYIESDIVSTEERVNINTDGSWRVSLDSKYHIYAEDKIFSPLYIFERVSGSELAHNWLNPDLSVKNWEQAQPYLDNQLVELLQPENLQLRKTPFMYRKNKRFNDVMPNLKSDSTRDVWQNMISSSQNNVLIAPHQREIVELSAEYEETSYLYMLLRGGAGTRIKILYAESYVTDATEMSNGMVIPVKGRRDDYQNGHLNGFSDYYSVLGMGDRHKREVYAPFWFRTFRYLRLEITTANEPLVIDDIWHEETGYPLDVKTHVETSDASLNEIWTISERTLRRCMHETYEDCPFYEQLQYIMDTRAQMLYTYAVANDDRLARKCIDQFSHALRPDGMLNCAYPSYEENVIPGYAVYYLLMLTDHWQYFKDINLIKKYFPIAQRILQYFSNNINEHGYLNQLGGLNGQSNYWSFIDWTPQWSKTSGVPTAIKYGPLTMESLLYLLGLQAGIELANIIKNRKLADKYVYQEKHLKKAILENCVGTNGLLQDGPGIEEYSQHTQVFGILTGVLTGKQAKHNLLQTIEQPEKFAQCSVAMSLYLFKALKKLDLYEQTNHYWDIWRRMLSKNVTTSVEAESGERSDCHAWGALILYELPTVTLGVRPLEPGYKKIEIAPIMGYLDWAKGTVITSAGLIKVSWFKQEDGSIKLNYEVPVGVSVVIK